MVGWKMIHFLLGTVRRIFRGIYLLLVSGRVIHQHVKVPKMEKSSPMEAVRMDTADVRENPPPKQLYKVQYLNCRYLNFLMINNTPSD